MKTEELENPFRYGSVVYGEFFTDRATEQQLLKGYFNSRNHVTIISPRRYGKTSLAVKTAQETGRLCIYINLQHVNTATDFASLLLKTLFKQSSREKIKYYLQHLTITPVIEKDLISNSLKVGFSPTVAGKDAMEDVFEMFEKIGSKTPKRRPIVILDEFQEINRIEKGLDRRLRSVLQMHQNVNYVFLGSQEKMMEQIFGEKKSPFYHFGDILRLKRIPYDEFFDFLCNGFSKRTSRESIRKQIAMEILFVTECHPYYTQQLAFRTYEKWRMDGYSKDLVQRAVKDITEAHGLDYERFWEKFNNTDRQIFTVVATCRLADSAPLYQNITGIASQSTANSSMKKLIEQGYIIRDGIYKIEDPFFSRWIQAGRE